MKVVIIGAGAAGMMFATQYKKLNPDHELIILEKSKYASWAGCPSPYYISNELDEKKVTGSKPEHFISKNLDLRINKEVKSINFDNKKVILENEEISYDKLVLALGAKPNLIIKKEKYFTLSHASEAIEIKKYLNENEIKKALVVGCGFIGLEMVEAFLKLNIQVTVVEKQENIFLNLPDFAREMLLEKLHEKKVNLITNKSIKEFNEDHVILDIDKEFLK